MHYLIKTSILMLFVILALLSAAPFTNAQSQQFSEEKLAQSLKRFPEADTDKDGKADQWTKWQEAKESYDYVKGFSKQVKKTPAKLDLSDLPEGFGFQLELRLTDATENASKPLIESLELSLE